MARDYVTDHKTSIKILKDDFCVGCVYAFEPIIAFLYNTHENSKLTMQK